MQAEFLRYASLFRGPASLSQSDYYYTYFIPGRRAQISGCGGGEILGQRSIRPPDHHFDIPPRLASVYR